MKIGDEYYEAYVDQYEGTVEMDLWIITAVRGGVVHACRKNQFTWVKRSKTNGDYGWARTLGQHDRKSFPESSPPAEWARTKAAAYSKALPEVEAAIKRLTKLRATMTGQRTRARPKPKTPKVLTALASSPSQGGETVDRSGVAAADNNHKALVERMRQQIPVTKAYLVQNGIDPHFADVLLSHYGDFADEMAAFQSRKEESR